MVSAKTPPKVNKGNKIKNSIEISKDILGFIMQNRPVYGDIFSADTITHDICFVTNPDYVKYVLQENNRNYIKSFGYEILKTLLGNGLLTSEGDFWRKQRRLAQPAFHKEKMDALAKTMSDAAGDLIAQWKNIADSGGEINILEEMNTITLDIVAKALFGADIHGNIEEIRKAITISNEFAIKRIMRLIRLPLWVPIPSHIIFNKHSKKLNDIIYGIIDQRRKTPGKHHDLLSMLLEAKDEETGERMTDEQLRDEVMTIFIAGHETTAIALSWMWYLLAKNNEAEEKAHIESKQTLNGGLPDLHHIRELKYVRNVIEETMRLYPPAWIVGRRPLKDDRIGEYHIAKGCNVLLSTYGIHRHPDYWKNPDKFDPERFSEENQKNIHKYAYFPFGGGPRLCIGNNFALMEAQIITATVLQHFKLELADDKTPEMEPLITLRPKGGIKMKIKNRT
jgi:cytochrome P450